MKNLKIVLLLALVCAGCVITNREPVANANTAGSASPESYQHGMKPYPPAAPGQARLTIHLPGQRNEDELLLRLQAGQTMLVDCNHQSIEGSWQQKTAAGWGYDYQVLSSSGRVISTLMGCLPKQPQRQAFVPVGDPLIVLYNSRLPVVTYVPGGMQVRYTVLAPQQRGVATAE